LNPERHDRHRIRGDMYLEKERGEELARKGDQIQGARGEGTLGERTREETEKCL
jgi:hypothetical protein